MSALAACVLALCPLQEPAPDALGKTTERVTLPRERKPLFMELTLANADPATPMLVLYHEARSSKGEYRPIVPRLRALGYNCLAVDLSSGGVCREVKNQTARTAPNANYLDALPDMLDSLRWAREKHAHAKLVAWGSSYSASLALQVAAEHPELVQGVIAFSPGEYFTALGKSATWIRETAAPLAAPVFVAAASGEEKDWQPIFEALASSAKESFVPAAGGAHGSRALWDESAGHDEYWAALESFLKRHFPPPAASPKDG